MPPLPEQRRIAAILDKANALRAKRREAIAKLDHLLQSVFMDMFGDPVTNPKGWKEVLFGDIFEITSSKRVLKKDWKKVGVPFYRAREIVKLAQNGYVDNELFITEQHYEKLSSEYGVPEKGDLMVSAVGTLGACYVVQPDDRFYFKDASVLRFHPTSEVEPEFFRYCFRTQYVLNQVKGGSGSTVGTYTISRAKKTRIYFPPIELQAGYGSIVHTVKRQKEMTRGHLANLDKLFGSLQTEAFQGLL